MRQFLLPEWYADDENITLRDEQYHYLVNVLRLKENDTFTGVDIRGKRYTLTMKERGNSFCVLTAKKSTSSESSPDKGISDERSPVIEKKENGRGTRARISLFQCVPKGKKMDTIIRQAVETGVSAVYPVVSRHTVPVLNNTDSEPKFKRWNTIVREALQQSGSRTITEIRPIIRLDTVPHLWAEEVQKPGQRRVGLFFHQNMLENGPLHEYLSYDPDEIALVVGPEGGLSENEVTLLTNGGFYPAYLGENVLRTETAALFAIAAVKTILAERFAWKLHQ